MLTSSIITPTYPHSLLAAMPHMPIFQIARSRAYTRSRNRHNEFVCQSTTTSAYCDCDLRSAHTTVGLCTLGRLGVGRRRGGAGRCRWVGGGVGHCTQLSATVNRAYALHVSGRIWEGCKTTSSSRSTPYGRHAIWSCTVTDLGGRS